MYTYTYMDAYIQNVLLLFYKVKFISFHWVFLEVIMQHKRLKVFAGFPQQESEKSKPQKNTKE